MTPRDPILIGLTGYAGAGKDTVAERLCERHGFIGHAFAGPLKAMLEAMVIEAGLDYAWIYERKLKEFPMPYLAVSARELMQTLGDWGRGLHPDWWVNLLAIELGLHELPTSAPVHDRIVLTDVRFPNEAAWLQRRGGHLVRVRRQTERVREHVSESHIDALVPAFVLDNTGSVAQLHDQVDDLAEQLLREERAA